MFGKKNRQIHFSIYLFYFLLVFLSISIKAQDREENDHATIKPQINAGPINPSHRLRPYQILAIIDKNEKSAGIYSRFSQKGVNHLTELASDVLPEILQRMVLPTIEQAGLRIKNIVITRFDRPDIRAKYISGHGVEIKVTLPMLQINGEFKLNFLFAIKGQLRAVMQNLTIGMKVHIHRDMITHTTNVTVYECKVVTHVPIEFKFFGPTAAGMGMFEEKIGSAIQKGLSENVCLVPGLVKTFLEAKRKEILTKFDTNDLPSTTKTVGPLFENYLCGIDTTKTPDQENPIDKLEESIANSGIWGPDLTLTFPPTFSDQGVIVGIDGGIVLNGEKTPDTVARPKFSNGIVVRDQMLSLIVNEYVPNTFLYHLYNKNLGTIHASFNVRDKAPGGLKSLAKLACPDCKILVEANLTSLPALDIDDNGIAVTINGIIDLKFLRENLSSELVGAEGKVRVRVKPRFRQRKIYSEISMTDVDFNIYKIGMNGIFANTARKLLDFIVLNAIWPKIQNRLRFLIDQRGIELPKICGVELNNLHIDYIRHAVVLSTDFTVDKNHLLHSFKQFMDDDLRNTETVKELNKKFHYL
uniref:Lipid-binding serum glycoprotein C-terminal domain-containing protein n=1 Tax=Acrobeloides nanus TaxID=290746 RepID=A0A914DNB3_9BILA